MWGGERRWEGIGARCPQTSRAHSFPGCQPPGLLLHVATSARQSQRLPRRPHLAATRPGQLLAIWKGADSGAGCRGLQVGREKLDPGAHSLVSFLSRRGPLRASVGPCPREGFGLHQACGGVRGKAETQERGLPRGCPAHTASPCAPWPLHLRYIPVWPGPKPQHSGGKEPGLRRKTTAGRGPDWAAAGERAVSSRLRGLPAPWHAILCNRPQPSSFPAGACPSSKAARGSWHLRGAGEREGSCQLWLVS